VNRAAISSASKETDREAESVSRAAQISGHAQALCRTVWRPRRRTVLGLQRGSSTGSFPGEVVCKLAASLRLR
jgi:hypothetical protein